MWGMLVRPPPPSSAARQCRLTAAPPALPTPRLAASLTAGPSGPRPTLRCPRAPCRRGGNRPRQPERRGGHPGLGGCWDSSPDPPSPGPPRLVGGCSAVPPPFQGRIDIGGGQGSRIRIDSFKYLDLKMSNLPSARGAGGRWGGVGWLEPPTVASVSLGAPPTCGAGGLQGKP